MNNFPCPHWMLDTEKEKRGRLQAYMLHDGEPVDGAVLVFAHSFQEAKKIGYRTVRSWTDCEYIDIKGHRIWNDSWLKEHAADQKKLADGEPHVIDNPPCCKGCELWFEELEDSGYCDTCDADREEAA